MLTLHGNWRYCAEDNPDFARPDFDDSSWSTMLIPQNWFLDGLDHHGVVWFRGEFDYKLPRRKFAALHFDGVDYFADVYLNGTHLGGHVGYFDPFSFDVTRTLKQGKNILAVRVDSPYETPGPDGWHMRKRLIKGVLNHHDCRPGGGWEPQGQSYNTGGIWNRVYLKEHGAVTIEQVLLHADLETQPPVLHVDLSVRNRASKQAGRLRVRCAPENFKGKGSKSEFTFELSKGESHHQIQLSVPNAALWNPWDRGEPNLYRVTLALGGATYESLFGFRTVLVDEQYNWHVNGQRYFPRGSNYLPSQWLAETLFENVSQSEKHPFGRRTTDERPSSVVRGLSSWFERDVTLARQANLNILRVHAHVLPPEFHQACDRAGVMVWQDFPLQWGYSDEPAFQDEAERQIRAMVTMLYNHPSIVAWCCHNESPWDAPWMAAEAGGALDPTHNRALDERLEAAVKLLDPTRYVHRNSGTGDVHTYPGWYFGQLEDYRELPTAPFVTEYGAQGLPVKENVLRMLPQFEPDAGHAQLVRFKAWLETQSKHQSFSWFKKHGGRWFAKTENVPALQPLVRWLKSWGMKSKGYPYSKIPPLEATPPDLHPARKVWQAWQFHDFQPQETFENGIRLGSSLDELIASSQAYQSRLIQFSTECYRRAKGKVTGIFQFDFTDPWPAVTWSVLDYWRVPKPAYDALRRAMQPVLPSFHLPDKIEAGKAFLASFCVVNDLTWAFPRARCEWRLSSDKSDIASATFPIDVPADGISAAVKVTLKSLGPGRYQLIVVLTTADGRPLGENLYEIKVV